ncbi:tRNA threonylcarbamoyladenosine dehydratase [Proteocatella sphenisci]|uniref:tRNA threonylcarbamoyladenosine dehydratase n=1 Tax=Proteocatella sphenisci TaxID=181070 RepID=UPI00048A4ADF|nr:tRNA threonylcarbamoyladenosine dehydratase [Proteocatella sphenisci]
MEQFFRTYLLFGADAMEILKNSHVAIFGVGGVGSFSAEAIVRSGVGEVTLVDFDTVDITNLNRQIPALLSTVGELKTEVMKERLLSINPNLKINIFSQKYLPENSGDFFKAKYDYVVDAIDIVTSKIHLIKTCIDKGIPVISSMGMGNKTDPSKIQITDLSKTSMCPLAKVMRKELRDRGIINLDVVYSTEEARKPVESIPSSGKREVAASCAFVPSVGGLFMASFVIRKLAGEI